MCAVERLVEICVAAAVQPAKSAPMPPKREFAPGRVVKAHGEGFVVATGEDVRGHGTVSVTGHCVLLVPPLFG